jgi:YedE family putative selenium metabolism protein
MRGLSREVKWMALAGLVLGVAGSLLALLGNPANTGICISCFLENFAGALGLHSNPRMQYIRPELLGFLLGSFAMAALTREVRPRSSGGGAGAALLGFLMIVGSAIFIGCPIKMVLRLAGGDLTAVAGGFGLLAGVWVGLKALSGPDPKIFGSPRKGSAAVFAAAMAAMTILTIMAIAGGPLLVSAIGGGALHAPLWASLGGGLVVGGLCQRSRFCVTGSVRDIFLTRSLLSGAGLVTALVAAFGVNLLTGQFSPGYFDQPGAHLEPLWAFLGMALTGWAAILAGGCPFRQIIKAGEGDLDAWTVCLGMVAGAILVQNWYLGATSAGVPPQGKAAILAGFAILASFGLMREKT